MKKLLFVVLILAVFAGSAFAFDILSYPPPVSGGNIMVDVGAGLVSTGYTSGKFGIPPLFVQAEFALPVNVPISVGGGVSFFSWNWDQKIYGNDFGFNVTYITPQARANWHWGFPVSWLDFYTGLGVGWDIVTVKYNDDRYKSSSAGSSGLYWGLQAGAHFYFSKNIGAMAETGWPFWLKGGLALKF